MSISPLVGQPLVVLMQALDGSHRPGTDPVPLIQLDLMLVQEGIEAVRPAANRATRWGATASCGPTATGSVGIDTPRNAAQPSSRGALALADDDDRGVD